MFSLFGFSKRKSDGRKSKWAQLSTREKAFDIYVLSLVSLFLLNFMSIPLLLFWFWIFCTTVLIGISLRCSVKRGWQFQKVRLSEIGQCVAYMVAGLAFLVFSSGFLLKMLGGRPDADFSWSVSAWGNMVMDSTQHPMAIPIHLTVLGAVLLQCLRKLRLVKGIHGGEGGGARTDTEN